MEAACGTEIPGARNFASAGSLSLMILDRPTFPESWLLSSIRYESELHNHTVVHSDASILPDNAVKPLATRSNHIEQYGARPDNCEITHIMHNQQPWANRSDKPCPVTYNPIGRIDEGRIVKKRWLQDSEARKWFNFSGRMMCGWRFRKA